MKAKALWRISVTTASEAEEAVSEFLKERFKQPISSYNDLERRTATVTLHFNEKPASSLVQPQIRKGLQHIASCGLLIGRPQIQIGRVPREDWAESWKRHFKPLEIGPRLLIKPTWSKRKPKRGQALVVLDPGLSFGTGQHPTTAFCLDQLATHRLEGEKQNFLDIGTGSGILAIAAAKLGYGPVEAFDYDREAVQIARANARKNQVAKQIQFSQQDVTRLPVGSEPKFSFICANLVSNLLLIVQARICSRLRANGVLVVAGILRSEFSEIQKSYEQAGFRLVTSRAQNEWRSGTFRKPIP
jgi:ribosomal protein L11 methyltransferase